MSRKWNISLHSWRKFENKFLESFIKAKNKQLEEDKKSLQENVSYLQQLLEDNCELTLYNKVQQSYCPELVRTVWDLHNLSVPTRSAGDVIKSITSICGRTVDRVPCKATVDNMVKAKVVVSQDHVAGSLADKKDTTLMTDETSKFGHKYIFAAVSDQTNSYLLGLREMSNKSSQTTLDTFQEITDMCSSLQDEEAVNRAGFRILSQIKNTMSDRASTEKAFNALLEEYRITIIPEMVKDWEDMNDKERVLCSCMNNFFCSLHLLVGMADCTSLALKKFESMYRKDKEEAEAAAFTQRQSFSCEAGAMRLVRVASKAFSRSGDEKSGCYSAWKSHRAAKNEKPLLLKFKGNRFNIIFLLAQYVYHLRDDISHFLQDVHGANNLLLKQVLQDIKDDLYVAGCRSLGLLSKLITGLLWRLA